MLEAARNLTRCRQQEGVAAWYSLLDDAKVPVVEQRITTYFSEIATHQRQMVARVDSPQFTYALHRRGVAHLATQRIAGIGGIGDHAARTHDRRRLTDEPMLGIDWMDRKKLGHETTLPHRQSPTAPIRPISHSDAPRQPGHAGRMPTTKERIT